MSIERRGRERREEEPAPYYPAARFSGEKPAGDAYFQAQDTIFANSDNCDLSSDSRLLALHASDQRPRFPEFVTSIGETTEGLAPLLNRLPSRVSEAFSSAISPVKALVARIQDHFKPKPDPCLVIVTEDGYWIEVDRWYS